MPVTAQHVLKGQHIINMDLTTMFFIAINFIHDKKPYILCKVLRCCPLVKSLLAYNPHLVRNINHKPSVWSYFNRISPPLKEMFEYFPMMWPSKIIKPPFIWVNYNDLTVLPSPGIMVNKGNHPQMALRFRLVNYCYLLRYGYESKPWHTR